MPDGAAALDMAGALEVIPSLEDAALEADGVDVVTSFEGATVAVVTVAVAVTVATGVAAGGALAALDVAADDVISAASTEAPAPPGATGSAPSPQAVHKAA